MTRGRSEPARVLLVEDDPVSAAYAQTVLSGDGHAVLLANDGATALQIVEDHRVDVAILDLMLPDMSGLELAQAIRRADGGSDLPMILVSAHFDPLDTARLSPIGFSDCLEKPLAPSVLKRAVRQLVPMSAPGPAQTGHGRRVLIVDDDPVLRRLMAIEIRGAGYVADVASDGLEALEMCHTSPPDAIVADALMPGLDGFGLCEAIRSEPATRTIPFVLVSSHYLEPEDADLGRAAGATSYLTRAPGRGELTVALGEAFDAPPPTSAGPRPTRALATAHAARVRRQLERQTRLNRALRERVVLQQALLSASAAIAESLASTQGHAGLLHRALTPILSARGFRAAIAYLKKERGALDPVTSLGPVDPEHLRDRLDLIRDVMETRETRAITASTSKGEDRRLLESIPAASIVIVPLESSVGTPFGAVVLISDLAELSAEVFAFTRTLRSVLGHALAHEGEEQRLRHAQKMDAVGRLSLGIAHDFNNVLAAISCFAEYLESALPPDLPQRAEVAEIGKSVSHGAALTSKLLAFSRAQPPELRAVRLDSVIGSMLPMLKRLLADEHEVIADLGIPDGTVLVDQGELEQVLVNLCINARDAMPAGGFIELSTRRETLAPGSPLLRPGQGVGDYAVLEIRDQGDGMGDAAKARAFEPFFTTKPTGKGTGLGLATTYAFVRRVGGHTTLESELGVGTTVRIVLPWSAHASRSTRPSPAPDQPPSGSETILLVEDDDPFRRILTKTLEASGYTVLDASNASTALELVDGHEGPIHVLVSDVSMPGMTGPALAAKLREERIELHVVFLSGYGRLAADVDGSIPEARFLAKPFRTDSLITIVRELLDEPRGI